MNRHIATQAAETRPQHPLDPLSVGEVRQTREILTEAGKLGDTLRFSILELREPPKELVLAYNGGDFPRVVRGTLIDLANGNTFEWDVDLNKESLTHFEQIDTGPEHGQAPIIIEEFLRAESIVKADPDWRAAVKRRGLSDKDIEQVQIDPISPGHFPHEAYAGRRILRAVAYFRESTMSNGYAHPIEGLVAVVDTIAGEVVHLHDDGRNVPIPKKNYDYDDATLSKHRPDLRPLSISQPEGVSFKVDGWKVEWQNWSFRVGFTPREGLVLHQVEYKDGDRVRPIIYRASVTEMAVPYADPTPQHFAKCAFDAGEYGLGKMANQLELGCDCLGHIHYFDVPAADALGQPISMKNAICMHEEDYGLLWKHYEFRNGIHQSRRSRRLVVSFIATVGNYDYGFYWYFYQDGTIQLEAKLTGIVQTAAVVPGERYKWGGMITPEMGGPTHQHFFSARLDMMIDGAKNAVTEHDFAPIPMGPDNPFGNTFQVTARTLKSEAEAAREADGATGRYWKIINPNVKNAVGNPTGYKLIVEANPLLMAAEGSSVRRRAGFATKTLWVTQYHPDERFASGDYPNQHAGECGVPVYARQNRNIENEDIVLWHTFGHTHVCKPEDFPIMPVEYVGFILKPNNFFDENAAMDVPPEKNKHSVLVNDSNPSISSCH